MSNSSLCLEQRQQEEQKSRKLLIIGLISSIVLHGTLGLSAVNWLKEKPKVVKKPIELIIIEPPKVVSQEPKLKPEISKPVKITPPPKPQLQKIPIFKTVQPKPLSPDPIQPRVERENLKPKSTFEPAPKPKTSPIQPSKPPVNQPPQRRILTNPSPTAPPAAVPETPKAKTNSSPVTSSEPLTNNNSFSEGISNTGTSQGVGNSSETGTGSGDGDGTGTGTGSPTPVAARPTPAPQPPKPSPQAKQPLKCVRGCKVNYPSVLNGVEGSASVKVTVDASGSVINTELARSHSNSQINEQALIAAQKMKFSPLSEESTKTGKVTINFTVAGSDFDRQARQRREQQERDRLAREQKQREQQEQQAREREQQRQAELEEKRQEQEPLEPLPLP